MTMSAEELKAVGNAFFASGKYADAVQAFSDAIELDPENAVLYSNRAAAFTSLRRWTEAIADAQKTTALRPEWGKGWGRLAVALQCQGDTKAAREAFETGLRFDPTNEQLLRGLEAVRSKPGRSLAELPSPFEQAGMMDRLRADPKVAPRLKDPAFIAKLMEMQEDPAALAKYLHDPGVMDALSVLMGSYTESFEQEEDSAPATATATATASTSAPASASATPEEAEAQRLKDQGTAAYRRRDFEAAMKCYADAFELTPHNPTLLLNQSAVDFEAGRYAESIGKAEKAVDLARSLDTPVDYTFYGKAYARMGNAYVRLSQLDEAIRFFNKSLTEHRCPDTLARLRDTEKLKADNARAALHDPRLAEEARNTGNIAFKEGRFADAVVAYSEAIRRDEKDPRAYSNRAACYLKLAAIPEGLRDCDMALQLDPSFTRAWIRKAALLFAKRDCAGCLEACETASQLDATAKAHTAEIQQQQAKALFEIQRQQAGASDDPASVAERVAKDPELSQILADPAMRMILQQMQSDPAAVQEHIRNPAVAAKIRKLVAAGVLRAG